mmetsp:Transcript_64405/g.122056  ORF Transcript_64405/g.122056 Transcript_64405/m.122056 type:complete len:909 (-) Transcript_64405:63-2789(-)
MQLTVAVRTLAGRVTWLQANEKDSVERFQAMIEECQGTPVSTQVLLIPKSENGRMTPGHYLCEYGLGPGDEVLLVRGLPPRPTCAPPKFHVPKHDGYRKGCTSQGNSKKKIRSTRKAPRVNPLPLPHLPPCSPEAALQSNLWRPEDEVTINEPQSEPSAEEQMLQQALQHPCVNMMVVRPPQEETRHAAPETFSSCQRQVNSHITESVVSKVVASSQSDGKRTPPSAQVVAATRDAVVATRAPQACTAQAESAGRGSGAHAPPVPAPPATHVSAPDPPRASPRVSPRPSPRNCKGAQRSRDDGLGAKLPIGRSGTSSGPGTPRAATGGTLSAPCTPRTPATPHPVASWAPPIINAAPAQARPAVKPVPGAETLPAPGTARVAPPGRGSAGGAVAAVANVPAREERSAGLTGGSSQLPILHHSPPANARIRRADLERIGRLGVGAFGVVTLEMDRRTGRTYALKAVSKGYLAQLHMEHSVLNEKRILKMVETPFIVRLLATYNGREHVYFLLEAALGGELFTTYERFKLYGSERHARFYVGCCVEALAHLHERHVIYRDLKPENLLLDARGYCKLTDMGLAKVTQSQTYTLVGTPDYMAPEVINCTGHGYPVDWWMLGVLLFELLVGRPPFEADTTEKVYESVRRGIGAVRFPAECRRAAELVRALCRHEPEARIRATEIRRDQWFCSFDWNALRACVMTPPHVPRVKGALDLANFRCCDSEDPPRVPYKDKGAGWDIGFEDDVPEPPVAAALGALPTSDAGTSAMDACSAESTMASLVLAAQNAVSAVAAMPTAVGAVTLPASGTAPSGLAVASGEELSRGSAHVPVYTPTKEVRSTLQAASPPQVPSWAWHASACATQPSSQTGAGYVGPQLLQAQAYGATGPAAMSSTWAVQHTFKMPVSPTAGGA